MNEKETICVQGKLLFKNNKVYSHISVIERMTELNGCEYFKKLNEQIAQRKERISILEKELAEQKALLLSDQNEALLLEKNGYCPIDKVETRLSGGLKQEIITHRDECRHRG